MKVNSLPVEIHSSCQGQTQEWKKAVREHIDDSVQAWVPAEKVAAMARDLEASPSEVKLSLLPVAALFAQAPISNFPVGALCEGASGKLYFGANVEIPYSSLDFTIHAEQASIVNALSHGETEMRSLCVTAAPCGYCRQFINELDEAAGTTVLMPRQAEISFGDLLPFAFGSGDLGVEGGMRLSGNRRLRLDDAEELDPLVERALSAADCSYAPYTGNYAGVAVRLDSDRLIDGCYLESAAFNPSVSPLQSAIVNLILHGFTLTDIREAVLVQVRDSLCDLSHSTRNILELLGGDKIEFRSYRATL